MALALGLPMAAGAAPILKFDDAPGPPGGTISYDGAGGSAVGSNIVFLSVEGLDTPLNAGSLLSCVGCLMNFQTGPQIAEGSIGAGPWMFTGGGQLTIVGSIPALGIPAGTVLVSGAFTGVQTQSIASTSLGQFGGSGFDLKDSRLAAFYGLDAEIFSFANTAIGSDLTMDANGGFSGSVVNADFNNSALATPVSHPATVLVIGAGLLGAAFVRWARRTSSHGR
ncbi:MAG: hypothetical protein L0027_09015 [Candidatus Rokubacteria bacterium]|nr:hypothetical protein [Candidatus Rokubacteria bacterium]